MKKHKGDVSKMKSLSKPTNVFKKSAKKPGNDDMPGKMRGGGKMRRLAARKI